MRVIKHLQYGRENGSSIVLMALFIVVLFGFAATAIDVARVHQKHRQASNGTDAGAMAGAALLTNDSVSADVIIAEATEVALANGITDAEIAAGETKDYPGAIQVGLWTEYPNPLPAQPRGLFTPTIAAPFNAVRVPARRTIQMAFAQVFGIKQMTPVTHSTAILTGANKVVGTIPMGVATTEIVGIGYGDTLVLENQHLSSSGPGPGNWTKINTEAGVELSGASAFNRVMQDGVSSVLEVGQAVRPATGYGGIDKAFADRIANQPIAILPIVTPYSSGSSAPVNIVAFAVVELISQSGNGTSWRGEVKFIKALAGLGGGGPVGSPFALNRVLVE